MCRLAYITKRFQGLEPWLEKMDKSCGGDGIGLVTAGRCRKGLGVTVSYSHDLIRKSRKPALWHTRRVSCGRKSSKLCHPFACAGGWLVHNGHWLDGAISARILGDLWQGNLSDTALFARLVNQFGFEKSTERYTPSGVWLWMDSKHQLSVYKNSGSLCYSKDLGAWGSESADEGNWISVASGFYGPKDNVKKEEPIVERIITHNPLDRSFERNYSHDHYARHAECYIDEKSGAVRFR